MNTQQVYEYVEAIKFQQQTEELLSATLQRLNSENYIAGTAGYTQKMYTQLVKQLLTEHQFEWLEWYMYDTDFGTESQTFLANNQVYNIKSISFVKFWEIVNEF